MSLDGESREHLGQHFNILDIASKCIVQREFHLGSHEKRWARICKRPGKKSSNVIGSSCKRPNVLVAGISKDALFKFGDGSRGAFKILGEALAGEHKRPCHAQRPISRY